MAVGVPVGVPVDVPPVGVPGDVPVGVPPVGSTGLESVGVGVYGVSVGPAVRALVVTPLHGQNRYAKLTEFDRELQVGLTYVKPSVVQVAIVPAKPQ